MFQAVPPGTYWLYLKMQDLKLRLQPEPTQFQTIELGSLDLEVVVPDSGSNEPAQALDLGSLELKR